MKSPEYVALVTGVYRAALDRAAADPGRLRSPRRRAGRARRVVLPRLHRGVPARRARQRDDELPAAQQPRRASSAESSRAETGAVTIALDAPLDAEDTIEFWTSAGRFAQAAGPLDVRRRRAPDGARGRPGDRRDRAQCGHTATASSACATLRSRIGRPAHVRAPGARRPRCALDVRRARRCRRAAARASSTTGPGAPARRTGGVVEPARTKAVTAEEVAEHVGRLGGTPYRIGGWDLELSPDVGVGFSALHRVRREALEAYEARGARAVERPRAQPIRRCRDRPRPAPASDRRPDVVVGGGRASRRRARV